VPIADRISVIVSIRLVDRELMQRIFFYHSGFFRYPVFSNPSSTRRLTASMPQPET
jgi:hypothetical protein